MNKLKYSIAIVLLAGSSIAQTMQRPAMARAVPVAYNAKAKQWNVLVAHDVKTGFWNDFARPIKREVRANVTASEALNKDTNQIYSTQILSSTPSKEDAVTGDVFHFVEVEYKPGRVLWKCARNTIKDDFAWIPVSELLSKNAVNRPHQRNDVAVANGFLNAMKTFWPAVEKELDHVVQPPLKKQRVGKKAAWDYSNFAKSIYFYDKNHPQQSYYYDFTNFQMGYPITMNGKIWPTTEHYYQAMKFADQNLQEQIRQLKSPREAFDFARSHKQQVRTDWQNISLQTMYEAVLAKFAQHASLKNKLLKTNSDVLIEDAGKNDDFFGAGQDYEGKNHLGQILMKVRAQLRRNDTEPMQYEPQDPSVYTKPSYDFDLL